MGLLSFFQRKPAAPAAKPTTDKQVQALRVKARRRLIGAAVLVGVGVIGFPLLFETQPRPIPVDLPIVIPSRDAVTPPLQVPPAQVAQIKPAEVVASAPLTDETEPAPPSEPSAVPESRPQPQRKAEGGVDLMPAARISPKPAQPAEAPAEPAREQARSRADAARAQALLEGKPAAGVVAASSKYIVQVGAYADSKAAQEARMKLERIGLKTYVQAVDTPAGKRIRVRLGPFESRDAADKAAAKARAAGLSTAVLTL